MALKLFVALTCCLAGVLLAQNSGPDPMRNMDEYERMVEDERARLSKESFPDGGDAEPSDGMQAEDVLADGGDVVFAPEPLYPDAAPQDLPALFMDYANMIRNDIVLLDNSVRPRPEKRGKVNARMTDPMDISPCSCIESTRTRDFGPLAFPRFIDYKVCRDRCSSGHLCVANLYNVTVLRRKTPQYSESDGFKLPKDLHKWVIKNELVTVGCTCAPIYN